MQTAKIVYWGIWIIVIGPLFFLNLKRILVVSKGKKQIHKGWLVFILTAAIFISGFLWTAYSQTLQLRYELAGERYIHFHAQYALEKIDFADFLEKTKDLRESEMSTEQLDKNMLLSDKTPAVIRFKLGSQVLPREYLKISEFPSLDPIDKENPIFLFYQLEYSGTEALFLLGMKWVDEQGWKIIYHDIVHQDLLMEVKNKNYLPRNLAKWLYID